jgi:hypothetical protein
MMERENEICQGGTSLAGYNGKIAMCSPKCAIDMPPVGGALVSHNDPAFDEGRTHAH